MRNRRKKKFSSGLGSLLAKSAAIILMLVMIGSVVPVYASEDSQGDFTNEVIAPDSEEAQQDASDDQSNPANEVIAPDSEEAPQDASDDQGDPANEVIASDSEEAQQDVSDDQDGLTNEDIAFGSAVLLTASDSAHYTTAQITSKVTLDGKVPGDKRFTFVLYDSNGVEVGRAQNDSKGNISFDPIDYTQTGTYNYKITELNDGQSGIIYDTKSVNAKVSVTEIVSELDDEFVTGSTVSARYPYSSQYYIDHYVMKDQTGTQYTVFCLNGNKKSPSGQSFYATEDEADSTIEAALSTPSAENLEKVKKCLYYFLLYPDEYTVAQQQRIIWKASGWSASGDSKYATYVNSICNQITELPANFHTVYFDSGNDTVQNLLYGYLAQEPTVTLSALDSSETAVFANSTVASAVITVKKTLNEQTPGDRRFKFQLMDENGDVIQTVENDSDGKITFDPITYTEAGTYNYTIREVNDGQTDINYDEKTINVSVEAEAGEGSSPNTAVTYDETTFENTITPSGIELPETGGMGDLPIELAGCALILTAVILFINNRRRTHN